MERPRGLKAYINDDLTSNTEMPVSAQEYLISWLEDHCAIAIVKPQFCFPQSPYLSILTAQSISTTPCSCINSKKMEALTYCTFRTQIQQLKNCSLCNWTAAVGLQLAAAGSCTTDSLAWRQKTCLFGHFLPAFSKLRFSGSTCGVVHFMSLKGKFKLFMISCSYPLQFFTSEKRWQTFSR